jgi:hypothetical protein
MERRPFIKTAGLTMEFPAPVVIRKQDELRIAI